jgi:hypothetical protein
MYVGNTQLTNDSSLCDQQSQVVSRLGTKLLQAGTCDLGPDGRRQVLYLATLSGDLCVETRLVGIGKRPAVDDVDGFERRVGDFGEGWLGTGYWRTCRRCQEGMLPG